MRSIKTLSISQARFLFFCTLSAHAARPVKRANLPRQQARLQSLTRLHHQSLNPNQPEAAVMAYGRFVPEREDDFTWENDKVAFRVYGPSSGGKGQVSGVDAWLKKVPYSIIDKWYAGFLVGKSYHEDHGEGYDPYHVGDSRGVGGTAIWVDGKAWPAGKYMSFEILQSGGEVVEFKLQYEWETPLGLVGESKTISLALGEQLYRVNSVFTLDGKPASLPVAIGLTTHDEKAQVFSNQETGRISAWEAIDEIGVGTGVLMAPDRIRSNFACTQRG